MEIRDYFAALAMQSLLRLGTSPCVTDEEGTDNTSQPWYFGSWTPHDEEIQGVDSLAEHAYEVADAMLEARDRTNPLIKVTADPPVERPVEQEEFEELCDE